jgi:hypothetical protein
MLLSDHLPFPDFFPWWWLHAVVFDEHEEDVASVMLFVGLVWW